MNEQTLTFGVALVALLLLFAVVLLPHLGPVLASAFTLDVVR